MKKLICAELKMVSGGQYIIKCDRVKGVDGVGSVYWPALESYTKNTKRCKYINKFNKKQHGSEYPTIKCGECYRAQKQLEKI